MKFKIFNKIFKCIIFIIQDTKNRLKAYIEKNKRNKLEKGQKKLILDFSVTTLQLKNINVIP